LIRRGDDANVNFARIAFADANDFLLLKDAQQFGCAKASGIWRISVETKRGRPSAVSNLPFESEARP
jgi:hypothetical protein